MKTQNEIFPILVTKCESLGWKINKKASARKNLESLVSKVTRLEKKVKERSLSPQEEKHVRQTLVKAMDEMGQNLKSIKAIEKSLKSEMTQNLDKSFESKGISTLWAEMLTILKNTQKVRAESTEFLEAWSEIEANHFTKVSLYNIEIERRS